MRTVVLDTSALIRFYVPDGPLPKGLEEQVASAWRSETILLIPELALAEAAQVLWKKEKAGYLESGEVDEILNLILELPLEIKGHFEIMPDAMAVARHHNLSIYDSIFFALASKKNAQLITADLKLANAFKKL